MLTNTVTFVGNLTADPELRRTGGGLDVANLRMGVSHRVRTASGEWEDRHDGFFTAVVWRELARHACATLRKGDRVVVVGRMVRRSYTVVGPEGEQQTRWKIEVEAEEICPSLRFAAYTRRRTPDDGPAAAAAAVPDLPPASAPASAAA